MGGSSFGFNMSVLWAALRFSTFFKKNWQSINTCEKAKYWISKLPRSRASIATKWTSLHMESIQFERFVLSLSTCGHTYHFPRGGTRVNCQGEGKNVESGGGGWSPLNGIIRGKGVALGLGGNVGSGGEAPWWGLSGAKSHEAVAFWGYVSKLPKIREGW